MSNRTLRATSARCAVCHVPKSAEHAGHTYVRDMARRQWPGWYASRRRLWTKVREKFGSGDTASKALGNSREVANPHYIKPGAVLDDVREAVNAAAAGLV
jgi:hypothetical protein